MTSGIKNIMQPKPLLLIFSILIFLIYSLYKLMKIGLSVPLYASLAMLLPATLFFAYLMIILTSYGTPSNSGEWVKKTDRIFVRILTWIEKYYSCVGRGWVFIISVMILALTFILDGLSMLFISNGIVSETIALWLFAFAIGSGLCYAYRNIIYNAENLLEYQYAHHQLSQREKTKNITIIVLFMLFIYPMPILTAIGTLEQILIALEQGSAQHIMLKIMEYLKTIPFFKFISYY